MALFDGDWAPFRPDVDDFRRGAVSYDKAKKAELRELATTYFGVLPDAMPGSENDNDHRRHLGEKLYFDTLLFQEQHPSPVILVIGVDQGLGGVDNAPGSRVLLVAWAIIMPTVLNAGFSWPNSGTGARPICRPRRKDQF